MRRAPATHIAGARVETAEWQISSAVFRLFAAVQYVPQGPQEQPRHEHAIDFAMFEESRFEGLAPLIVTRRAMAWAIQRQGASVA